MMSLWYCFHCRPLLTFIDLKLSRLHAENNHQKVLMYMSYSFEENVGTEDPSRGVLITRGSENMRQITGEHRCRSDFNKVAQSGLQSFDVSGLK